MRLRWLITLLAAFALVCTGGAAALHPPGHVPQWGKRR